MSTSELIIEVLEPTKRYAGVDLDRVTQIPETGEIP